MLVTHSLSKFRVIVTGPGISTAIFRNKLSKNISAKNFVSSNAKLTTNEQHEKDHYFGFQKVSSTEKREKVQSVFTDVAAKYDLMNDVMSFGIHRLWKDHLINVLSPTPGTKLLDVAGGTGDIAIRFLQASVSNSHDVDILYSSSSTDEGDYMETNLQSHVVVLDINDKMLSLCKDRAKETGFDKYTTCIQGNAEQLPFKDDSFDAYTVAYGIRNVVHIQEALEEAFRVLRPGGRFLCLEFSEVRNPAFGSIYDWYSEEIIPVLGQVIAGNWRAYQYLIESIKKFPNQEDFSYMIEEAGFNMVTYENLLNGISAIHSAYKL